MSQNDYNLIFSDPRKTETVVVPGTAPYINLVDTSLALIGRGYPDYGRKLAQNFLSLLENFSGPNPPSNPIEGQLWYDTSNPNRKVLRIMDGTASSTSWSSANGIFQQGTDPKLTGTSVKVGDLWVDTSNNLLKLFNSNSWVTVGPSSGGSSLTGVSFTQLMDTASNPHWVTTIIANNQIIAIISQETFILRGGNIGDNLSLDGFYKIVPGINLPRRNGIEAVPVFNGISETSKSLISSDGVSVYTTDKFLRKDDTSAFGQVITGNVVFKTAKTSGEGSHGVVIKNDTSISSTKYIQFYKNYEDAIILNNSSTGRILFKIRGDQGLSDILVADNASVTSKKTLIVESGMSAYTAVIGTSTSVSISQGSITADGGAIFGGNVVVSGNTTSTGVLTLGSTSGNGSIIVPANSSTYSIGSMQSSFKDIYMTGEIKSPAGSLITVYGNITGNAGGLQNATTFRISGQVQTVSDVVFNGSGADKTFQVSLSPTAISAQSQATVSTSSHQILVLDTSTSELRKMNRDAFIGGVFPPGFVSPFGGTGAPVGWLACDGSSYSNAVYQNLYGAIGMTFGGDSGAGTFKVPNMTTSTYVTTGTNTGTYINYIIKT
jgi:hypothetical protein